MKSLFNKKVLVFAFFLSFLCFGMLENVYADATADTSTYFKTGRGNGVKITSSSDVILNKAIPSEYSFALGDDFDGVTISGYESLSSSEISKWDEDTLAKRLLSYGYATKLDSSIKGKYSATYKNVGKYMNSQVDVKLTIMDYAVSDAVYYPNYTPFISFLTKEEGRLGLFTIKVDWVKIKYEFFKSGTNTPISVKGYTSYWDVDLWQGIHLLDNNKGIYSKSSSLLNISDINGKKYVYDSMNEDWYGNYNPIGAFTELFEGSSMTRVYTVSRPEGTTPDKIDRARGWFWHSDVTYGARKEYAVDTPKGYGSSPVSVGDTIKYAISYTNDNQVNSVDVTITDVLSKGLKYVKDSSSIGEPTITENNDGTTTLVWKTTLEKDSTAEMTYSVLVTDDAKVTVSNKASVLIGDDPLYELDPLVNPIPKKEYASDTPSGMDGATVKVNDEIKYQIIYANPYLLSDVDVTITDVLSKGLEYVKGSSSIGEPKVSKNSDGSSTLVWTKTVKASESEILNYKAKVTGDVKKVKNNASIVYGNGESYFLGELVNPLEVVVIKVPDTGSVVSIVATVFGIILIGGGGYLIYNRSKNNK